MRFKRSRNKKLIVALHFRSENQAAWSCEACRNSGLEKRRRCGWLASDDCAGASIVWARGRTTLATCPNSYVTPESIALLEEYGAWKLFGAEDVFELPARLVHAIFILENELGAKGNDGRK